MKEISIIIPAHNNSEYLELLLHSIDKYQNANHEIVIIDDGSTDDTEELIKKWSNDRSGNIIYHKNISRLGICQAVEKGIELSTKDIILYIHADMVMGPDFDSNLYKYLQKKTVVSATRIEPPLFREEPYKIICNCGIYPSEFNEEIFLKAIEENKRNDYKEGIFVPYMFYKEDWIGYDPIFYPATREDSITENRNIFIRNNNFVEKVSFEKLWDICEGNIIKKNNKEYKEVNKKIETISLDKNNRGIWSPIKTIIRHKNNKKIFKIIQKWGQTQITEDHGIFDKYMNVKTPLTLNDDILTCRYFKNFETKSKYLKNEILLSFYEEHYSKVPKIVDVKIDEEVAFILGNYLAEGSIYQGTMTFTCGNNKKFIENQKKIIEDKFQIKTSITESKKKNYKNVYAVRKGNKSLCEWFLNTFGKNSEHKKIPNFIFNSSIEIKKQFMLGYMCGDGYISNNHKRQEIKCFEDFYHTTLKITTKSRNLVEDLSFLIKELLPTKTISIYDRKDKKGIYQINVNTGNINKKSIKPKTEEIRYDGYVYDLEIDSDTHIFTDAFGLVCLHNSDKFNRWKEAGITFITSKDALVYHFCGRGGRRLGDAHVDQMKWKMQERKNIKNFIRKWKSTPMNTEHMNPIISKKDNPISCIVWIKNEEKLIYNFLEQVEPFFEDVLIVDDYSEDNSMKEIERYMEDTENNKPTNFNRNKIRIIKKHVNDDFGEHVNFSLRNCIYDWCFKADTDEVFSPVLLNNLHNLVSDLNSNNPSMEAVAFPRMNFIDGILVNDIPRNIWFSDELQKHKENRSFENKDYQYRLLRKNCIVLNKVHEIPKCVLEKDVNKFAITGDDMLIYHNKTASRQKRQNEYYSKLINEKNKEFNKIFFDSVIYTTEGITKHARQEIMELKRLGYEIQLTDAYRNNPNIEGLETFREMYKPIDLENDNYITIINQPPVRWERTQNLKNAFGFLAFEGHLIPDWVNIINNSPIKMLMTPSSYCKQKFIESGVQKPIEVIPHGIDSNKYYYKKTDKFPTYTFLWAGTPHISRKGLDIMVKSFKKAFGNSEEVQLLIKANKIYNRAQNVDSIIHRNLDEGETAKNIKIIDDEMNEDEMIELFRKSHCYVSTSRSEGFGIIILESMALGTPVITTDAGGNMDFCTSSNCIITKNSAVKYAPWVYPYYNTVWNEPSIESLSKELKEFYDISKDENALNSAYEEISKNIIEKYSWKVIVVKMLTSIKKYL